MTNRSYQNSQISSLTFSELEFFLTLYRLCSITDKAKKYELTVPAASRVLKKLRGVFDDPLFIRSNPKFLPTNRAHELSIQIEDILCRMSAMTEHEDFDPASLTRTFRIAAADNAIMIVLRDFIDKFYEVAPNAVLEFQQLGQTMIQKLEDGQVDVAIYPSTRNIPPKIHERRLYPVRYKLCVRKGHPLQKYWLEHQVLPLEEIAKYRKIVVANQLGSEAKVYSLDETNLLGQECQKIGLSLPYFVPIPSILEKTDLTVLLPDETAQVLSQTYGAKIALLPYGDSSENFTYWTRLIWHERTHYDTVMQWFRGLLVLHASKHHGLQ